MESRKKWYLLDGVVQIAREEYINWITGSRMLLLVFLFVYAKEQISDPLLKLVELTGDPLQVFEPGIAFLGSRTMMMVLPLIYLVLMGDFPGNNGNRAFFIIRTGKGAWLAGQILFAFVSGLTTILMCVVSVTLPCMEKIVWNGGNWSDAVTKYYLCEDVSDFKFNLITEQEYNQMMPGMAFLHSILLVLLFLLFLSVLQMMFSVCERKVLGLALAGILVVTGNAFAIMENQSTMWYFPSANTQIWLRHDVILKEESVALQSSYFYFIVWIAVFMFCSWRLLKRANFK